MYGSVIMINFQKYASVVALFEEGKYEEGLDLLKNIYTKSNTIEEKLEIAQIYIDLGLINEARSILDSLATNHASIDIKRLSARISFIEGNYNDAQEIMHEIVEDEPIDEDYFILSQVYFEDGLPEISLKYIKKAIEMDQNNPNYFYHLGIYSFELGELEEAIKSLKQAISLDNEEPIYYLALGEALYLNGYFEEALENIDASLELSPDYQEALYLKGIVLIQVGDVEDGIVYLEKLSEYQPENLSILIALVDAYEMIHMHDDSYNLLNKIVEIDSYYAPALKRLASMYIHEGEDEKAIELIEKALDVDPDDYSLQEMKNKLTNY